MFSFSKLSASLFFATTASAAALTACTPAAECARDDDCSSEICADGECVECENNRDCDDDEQCDDGECRDVNGNGNGNGGEGEGEGEGEGNVIPLSVADRACARFDECDVPPPEQGTCSGNLASLIDTVESVNDSLCSALSDALDDAFECESTASCAAITAGTECPTQWERVDDLFADGADACLNGEVPSEPSDVPAGWQCDPTYFGDGDCDCGCGVIDSDCNGGGCATPGCAVDQCDFCFDGGETVECAVDVPEPQACDVSAFANPNGNGSLTIGQAIVTVSDENFGNCATATQVVILSLSGSMSADLDGDEVSVSSAGNAPFLCGTPALVDDGVLACIICGGTTAATTLAVQIIDDAGTRSAATCVEPG